MSTLLSKKKLWPLLDDFLGFGAGPKFVDLQLNHPKISNETYGNKSMVYIATNDVGQRRRLEDYLSHKGFKVHEAYHPSGCRLEVQVSYFKGYHWNE